MNALGVVVKWEPAHEALPLKIMERRSIYGSQRCWQISASTIRRRNPKLCLNASLNSVAKKATLLPISLWGSGTTAAVAEKLGRKWIATDWASSVSIRLANGLIGVQREKKAAGQSFRAFEVLNLGRYERQAYLNVGGRLTGTKRKKPRPERK